MKSGMARRRARLRASLARRSCGQLRRSEHFAAQLVAHDDDEALDNTGCWPVGIVKPAHDTISDVPSPTNRKN